MQYFQGTLLSGVGDGSASLNSLYPLAKGANKSYPPYPTKLVKYELIPLCTNTPLVFFGSMVYFRDPCLLTY
jgi:hypothetical protein